MVSYASGQPRGLDDEEPPPARQPERARPVQLPVQQQPPAPPPSRLGTQFAQGRRPRRVQLQGQVRDGVITQLYYTHPTLSFVAPYQVRLCDGGQLIFSATDAESN